MGAEISTSWVHNDDLSNYVKNHKPNETIGAYARTQVPDDLEAVEKKLWFDTMERLFRTISFDVIDERSRTCLSEPNVFDSIGTCRFLIDYLNIRPVIRKTKEIIVMAINLDEHPEDRKQLEDLFTGWEDRDAASLVYLLIQLRKIEEALEQHRDWSLVVLFID